MQRIQRHGYYGIRGARAAYKIFIRGCTMDINHIMALEVLWPNVRFVSGAAPWINMVLEVLRLHKDLYLGLRHGYYGIRGAQAANKISIRGRTMNIIVLGVLRLHIRFVSGAATWILWYYY